MKQPITTKRSNSRSKSKLPSRVFAFGCRRPEPEDEQFLRDQALKATDVQAAMVCNEMATRKQQDEIYAKHVPEYRKARKKAQALSEQLDGLYEHLAKERQRKRKRVRLEDVEAEIRDVRKQRKTAWEEAAAAKRVVAKELKPYWGALEAQKERLLDERGTRGSKASHLAQRDALVIVRKQKGVPRIWLQLAELGIKDNAEHCAIRRVDWCPPVEDAATEYIRKRRAQAWETPLDRHTKEFAREAFNAAKKKTLEEGGTMREPRGSEGRVGLMFGGDDVPVIQQDGTIDHSKLTLVPQLRDANDNRDPKSRRSQLRKRMLATLRIAGRPTAVKVLVHRQMPAGAWVKRAWILIKPRGCYELQLVVQHADLDERPRARRKAFIAVKPTWRVVEGGDPKEDAIIAAEWRGSDGATGTIELDARTNQAFEIIETLCKQQDDHHNEAKALAVEMAGPKLKPKLRGHQSWRSPRHLAAVAFELRQTIPKREELWQQWKRECLQEGVDLFPSMGVLREWLEARGIRGEQTILAVYLEWWRRKNRHLRNWEQNMRETVLRRRREGYRVAGARLAGRYETLLLCPVDLKSAARKKRAEQDVEGPEKAWTGQRRRAAPSELVKALTNAFRTKEVKARMRERTPVEALVAAKQVA